MRIWKRLTALALTLSMVMGLFVGLIPAASAAEEETYTWTSLGFSLAGIGESDTIAIVITTSSGSYILNSANGSSGSPSASGYAATIATDGKLTTTGTDNIGWTVSGSADDGYVFTATNKKGYLYCTDSNTGVRVGSGDYYQFSLSGNYLSVSTGSKTRYIGVYSAGNDFRCYTSTTGSSNITGQTTTFYKLDTGTGGTTDPTEPAAEYTVTFYDFANNTVVEQPVTEGKTATEPTAPTAPDGYTFMGWSTTKIESTDAAPELYDFTATVSDNFDLYAVYAVSTTSGSADTYTLVTSANDLAAGEKYIMVGVNKNAYVAASTTLTNKGRLEQVSISAPVDGTVTVADTSVAVFTLGGETGTWTLTFDNEKLSASSATKFSTDGMADKWSISIEEKGARIANNSYTGSRVLYNTSSKWFAPYGSSTDEATSMLLPYLYKQGGTNYSGYTTNPSVAETYTVAIAESITGGTVTANKQNAAAGATVQLTATPDDGYSFVSWQVTDAAGNAVPVSDDGSLTMPKSNVTVSATFTQRQTHTITVTQAAGGTIAASASAAVAGTTVTLTATPDEHYTFAGWTVTGAEVSGSETSVSFSMPENDVTVTGSFTEDEKATVQFIANGHTLQTVTDYVGTALTAPEVQAVTDFAFVGWVAAAYDAETAPTLASPSEIPAGGAIYYALYGEQAAGGSDTYTLVTDASQLALGASIVIAAASFDVAMSTEQKTSNRGEAAITKHEDNTLTITDDVQEFTLEAGTVDGSYSFNTGSNTYIYAASSSQNYLKTGYKNDNASWVITISANGEATLTAQGTNTHNVLRYNKSSKLFACYTSVASAQPIALYQKAGYSYYTTNPVAVQRYTVTWIVNGVEYAKTSVRQGKQPTPPADPTCADEGETYYVFLGWASEEDGAVLPEFPAASADTRYYAVFAAKTYQYTASISGSESVKQGASRSWTATLTVSPEKTLPDYTVHWSSDAEAVATVDANGTVTGVSVGTANITVTYQNAAGNVLATATKPITVTDAAASVGGYTLMTKKNTAAQESWAGEYIIMGRTWGGLECLNDYKLLTPTWTGDSATVPGGTEANASKVTIPSDATLDGTAFKANIMEYSAGSGASKEKSYTVDSGNTLTMESTGQNNIEGTSGTEYVVYDRIAEISEGYAFVFELVDDVNMYYTIRVKGTDFYLANENTAESDNNKIDYTMTVEAGDTKPLWTIRWATEEDGLSEVGDGYTQELVLIESVYAKEKAGISRALLLNSAHNGNIAARFNAYGQKAYKNAENNLAGTNTGNTYILQLFGNPNPFTAQITYQGEQITITNPATIPSDRELPVALGSVLTPNIASYPNWEQVGSPTWKLISDTSGVMTLNSEGVLNLNGADAGKIAIVEVSYLVRDTKNNVTHTVSTQAKVVVDAAASTYSTVIYENASGNKTEVSYTVSTDSTALPFAAYVVDDKTGGKSTDADSKVTMSGTVTWSAVIAGTETQVPIDANGKLDLTGVTQECIILVTATGATGATNGSAPVKAADASYKVYVKKVEVAVQLQNDTVVLDFDRSVTFDVLKNDALNGCEVANLTVSAGAPVTVGSDFKLTYVPNGFLEKEITFTYTVALTDGREFSATVTIVPHSDVYYEDSNSAFTYTDGKRGYWELLGTESVNAQTDPLTATDILGYDENYKDCATYSAGSTHKVSVSNQSLTARPDGTPIDQSVTNPKVAFAFYGTGFDVVSLTSNNTGVFKLTVDGEVQGVVQTYYGYTYSEEAVEVTEYASYTRYCKNEDGSYSAWDGTSDPSAYHYIARYTEPAQYIYVETFYVMNADGSYSESATGTYVRNIRRTNWVKTEDADNALYQIPVIKLDGLTYGKHTVVIEVVYSQGFDIQLDGAYDFYFDAVRIHNPIQTESGYAYLSIRDGLIDADAFGSGTATPATHTHTAAVSEPAKAATCTEAGNIAYWMCECGKYFKDEACTQEVSASELTIAALDHAYQYEYYDEGYHAVTCSRCRDNDFEACSYENGACTKCGHTAETASYTASFRVAGGAEVDQISGLEITLPTAEGYTDGGVAYSFVGWVDVPLSEKRTDAPDFYAAGTAVTLEVNRTFYALYSHTETGGSGDYVKVTTAPDDWSGQYVIVYEDGSCILDGSRGDSAKKLDATSNYQTVTISGDTISVSEVETEDGNYYVTITEITGGYSIQTASGYYIGASSNSNSLKSSKTTVYTNTLSLNNDGSVNIISSGAYLRFNKASDQTRFRYFQSSTYTKQQAIALYKKADGGSTMYYTTAAAAEATATRSAAAQTVTTAETGTENYAGAVFIDGIGESGSVADMKQYGPKNEVYLAKGQAIVFYLKGTQRVDALQIGAKAVRGTATLKITALNAPDEVALERTLATCTEMYYEFGAKVGWDGGTSSPIVIQNTGEGILSITNLRYQAADGTLQFFVNSDAVRSARQLVASGNSDPCAFGHNWDAGTVTREATCEECGELRYTCLTCGMTRTETIAKLSPVTRYTDLEADAWYYSGAKFAIEAGLMTGGSDTSFYPEMELSRAMVVQVLYALRGKPAHSGVNPFSDLDAGAWYYDAVLWAAENGIVAGSNGRFDPNGLADREQTVTILYAFAAHCGVDTDARADLTDFADFGEISDWAYAPVAWAVAHGLISGTSTLTPTISPKFGATRAQFATILQQFCKIYLAYS